MVCLLQPTNTNRERETDTKKMKIWWNFQFNYSGNLEVLCIKSPQKFHKIVAHKIHRAPTEFFQRHKESDSLWLLNSPEIGQKVCSENIHEPKQKEKKLFENYLTGVCRIFIMINSLQTPVK